MLDRLLSAVVALSMALLVWLYMRSRDQEILDNVPVPVHISLAPGVEGHYELELTGSDHIPVSFTGSPSRLRELRHLLQRGELDVQIRMTVPPDRLEESRYVDSVVISAGDIHPPPGVTPLVPEGRNRLQVVLHRIVERRLPVRLEQLGSDRASEVTVQPASVMVRGPQELLDKIRSIPTQPYSLPPQPATSATNLSADNIPLVQELEGRRIRTTPATVSAKITLPPQQKVHEIPEVPVQFLCAPNFGLRALFTDDRAGKMALRLLGPAVEDPPAITAYVDLSNRKWEPGLFEEPVKIQLPKGFQLDQNPPRPVAFQLVLPDAAVKPPGSTSSR